MAVFFKIGEDGKKVYVAKTIFAKEISEKDFSKTARRISVDNFLEKWPKETSDKLEKIIDRVREINEMKLRAVQIRSSTNPNTKTTHFSYHVGDKVFKYDVGEEAEHDEKGMALDYIRELFNRELADNYIIPFVNESTWNALYFSDQKEISGELYDNLKIEHMELTSIKSVDRLLNKSTKDNQKTR